MLRRYGARLKCYRNFSLTNNGTLNLVDDMSVTHGQLMDVTLASHLRFPPGNNLQRGEPVPPGYFLAYFNHRVAEFDLGEDGYDNLQAPVGYPIRRWLGGKIEFNVFEPLLLGEVGNCKEHTAEIKERTRHAIVTIHREMKTAGRDWAVREQRSLLYLKKDSELLKSRTARTHKPTFEPQFSHRLQMTQALLFRYSSLTFNCHRVHFDSNHATKERLPRVIAQGPLMVTLLLRWFGEKVLKDSGKCVLMFEYRNVAPLFVNSNTTLCARQVSQSLYEAWILDENNYLVLAGKFTVGFKPEP